MESILLIDDDEPLREALRLALERAGYEVIAAGDGAQGLRLFRQGSPDLVITDIVMEGQEGIETIRAMRRELPQVKIIAMSGGGSTHSSTYLDAAKCLGAQETMEKPFELSHLVSAVRRLLSPKASPS